eukprot:5504964-Amphidinium_carterae.11
MLSWRRRPLLQHFMRAVLFVCGAEIEWTSLNEYRVAVEKPPHHPKEPLLKSGLLPLCGYDGDYMAFPEHSV